MALADYASAVLADSPLAYWELQEASGNPQDSSGNGRHITTTSGTPDYRFATGPCGDDFGIQLAGGEMFSRSVVSTATNNVTIELWYKHVSSGANNQNMVYNGNSGSNGWGIIMGSSSGPTYRGLCGGVALLGAGATALGTTNWHHLVINRDSGDSNRWKLYLDGAVDNSNAGTTNPSAPAGNLGIGTTSLQAIYAHVAVYGTALSAARILAHYNAALAVASSGFAPKVMVF